MPLQIKRIALELLNIIRETENDDLTSVMQKLVCTYTEQLTPIAVEMCTHLVSFVTSHFHIIVLDFKFLAQYVVCESLSLFQAATFSQVLESDEGSDEKAITAMGLLNTIEALLSVMEEQPEIIAQLQPIVLQVVGHIFSQSVMGEKRANLTKGDFCCNGLNTTLS